MQRKMCKCERRMSSEKCERLTLSNRRSMRFLQFLRAFFAANFNRLTANRDFDRVLIQLVVASRTSLFHDRSLQIPGNSGHTSSRPDSKKKPLSESLAILSEEKSERKTEAALPLSRLLRQGGDFTYHEIYRRKADNRNSEGDRP